MRRRWSTASRSTFEATTTERPPAELEDAVDAFVLISSARTNTRMPVKLESVSTTDSRATRPSSARYSAVPSTSVRRSLSRDPVRIVGD